MIWAAITVVGPRRATTDVLTARASKGVLVITVTERGEIESAMSKTTVCEVDGGAKIATIVAEGTRVKKGDVVCRFDTAQITDSIAKQQVLWEQADGKARAARSDLDAQRDKADQEIAKADLKLVLADIDYESYEIGEYNVEWEKRKGAVELAKKDLTEAEDGLTLTRQLTKKGNYTLEQLRAAELGVENKRYELRQKDADLMVLEKFTKKRKLTELRGNAVEAKKELERTRKIQAAATAKAESDLNAAVNTAALEKTQLDRLREQLQHCSIEAPQDGIAVYAKRHYWDDESNIRPGAQVYFQQPIITLPDLNQMQVKIRVHESVVKKILKGQSATLQMEALPGVVLHGKVVSVATQAQSQGWRSAIKDYETIVSIDDLPTDAGLRPGMTAEVKVLLKTVSDALTVPVQAVTEFDSSHVAYVQTAGGLERREVTLGESNDTLIQVLEGLTEGTDVALDARVRAAAELKSSDSKQKPTAPTDEPKATPTTK